MHIYLSQPTSKLILLPRKTIDLCPHLHPFLSHFHSQTFSCPFFISLYSIFKIILTGLLQGGKLEDSDFKTLLSPSTFHLINNMIPLNFTSSISHNSLPHLVTVTAQILALVPLPLACSIHAHSWFCS